MINIEPFRAFTYNKHKIKNINNVIAPPYDVISDKQRDILYNRNKYNIIRIILGKKYSQDTNRNNQYTRAAKFLKKWQQKNILIQDKKPSIYIYRQNYHDKERRKRIDRLGFVCLFKLQEFGKDTIYPHEHTLNKPKADRLKILKNTKATYSPIFSLYFDQEHKTDKILKKAVSRQPLLEAEDEDDTYHIIYKMDDLGWIQLLKNTMKSRKVFIADGHHRYETALNYFTHTKNKKENASRAYTMMYFTNLADEGLNIYPIHRLIKNIKPKKLKNLKKNLNRYFNIHRTENKEKMQQKVQSSEFSDYVYGLYYQGDYYLLTLKDKKALNEFSDNDKLSFVDKLDVALLHKLIIKRILKIPDKNIEFLHDSDELITQVKKRNNRIGIFVPSISPQQITKIALQNERLPLKSTYFYPKLYSGLLINKIESP